MILRENRTNTIIYLLKLENNNKSNQNDTNEIIQIVTENDVTIDLNTSLLTSEL